jgi:hypothetical protein
MESEIMENKKHDLTNMSKAERISELIQFIGDNRTRQEQGWFEHTSDWDPFLLIKLSDGEKIETAAGYDDCKIINFSDCSIASKIEDINEIEVLIDNELDEEQIEPIAKRIPIMSIQSLVWRYH